MKEELYNRITNPDFINNFNEPMKINSNDKYDVFAISEGNGRDITFEILNYKHNLVVFSYTLDTTKLTYRDVNGIFYDINNVINKSDEEDYMTRRYVLLHAAKYPDNVVPKVVSIEKVYCNHQFKEIYRDHIDKKLQRNSKYNVRAFPFTDICEDRKYETELYLNCGMYVIEVDPETGILSSHNILMLPIDDDPINIMTITFEYNDYVFPYPVVDDYTDMDELERSLEGLEEWYEIKDDTISFINRESEIHFLR